MSGWASAMYFGIHQPWIAAVRKDFRGSDHLAAFQAALHEFRLEAHPGFRRDVRLALFSHGGERRHGIAADDLGRAAVTFLEDDLVEICCNFGRSASSCSRW